MKINLPFFLLLLSFSQAVAQTDPVYNYSHRPELKLYRVTTKPVSDERFTGILYSLTDTTLVYFDSSPSAVQRVKLGFIPELKTVKLTDIKKVAIRRRGHFWRTAGLGIGLAAVTFFVLAPANTPTWNALFAKIFLGYIIAPSLALSGVARGVFPEKFVYILGSPYYVSNACHKLYRYTVTAQQSAQ